MTPYVQAELELRCQFTKLDVEAAGRDGFADPNPLRFTAT